MYMCLQGVKPFKSRPAWSLSPSEAAAQADAEEAELLGFAEELDWEAFIEQLDDTQLAQAFQVQGRLGSGCHHNISERTISGNVLIKFTVDEARVDILGSLASTFRNAGCDCSDGFGLL